MAQTDHTLLFSTTSLLLRRAMLCMTVALIVITGTVLTGPVQAFAFQTSPSALSFTGTQGAINPSAQSVTVWKRGVREKSWTANVSASWLTVNPMSGSISTERDEISVGVNLSGIAAGTHNATITITVPGAPPKSIPVTLTVTQATPMSGFSVSPSTLAYTGTVGGSNQIQGVTVTNTGTSTLTVTWSDSINWLVATSGDTVTMPPGGSATITHTASPAGLGAGTYSGIATIAGGGTTKQVPITLTLTATSLPPAIGLNTTSLGFAGTVGGTNPSAQTFAISNTGGGTLTWSAGDNATWLTLSPLSGTNAGTITASVNVAGLLAGSYPATITVTATGATPKTIPVTLTITASTSGGSIGFSPASLAFSGTVGGTNPAAKPFTITNSGGGTLTWTISSNAVWLRLNTASGTTTTETDTISASVTTSGLAAGTYNAVLTVTASGSTNSPRSIPVSLNLSATVAGTAGLAWNANSETDLAGYKIYKATSSGAYGAPVATLPKTTTNYTVTGLQTGTTYFFAITAYDNTGNESPPSGEVSKSIF